MKLFEIKQKANQYKLELKAEEAWDLLNTHCKDALKDLDQPIVRGMTSISTGFGVINGEAGQRKSANTSNYYTVILDEVLSKLGYPKRSKSIICANYKNMSYAAWYGDLYAIIPFDGVKIGVCPERDMWETMITLGPRTEDIETFNDWYENIGIKDDDSFQDIIAKLEDDISKGSSKFKLQPGKVLEKITKAYAKPFKLATTATSEIYNDVDKHEVWIGGKCVAINMKIYKNMMSKTR